MSATSCVVFYGVRFELSDQETGALERKSHPLLYTARAFGLDTYWGFFGADGEKLLFLVGKQICLLGAENDDELSVSLSDLVQIGEQVAKQLALAKLPGIAQLHMLWQPDL